MLGGSDCTVKLHKGDKTEEHVSILGLEFVGFWQCCKFLEGVFAPTGSSHFCWAQKAFKAMCWLTAAFTRTVLDSANEYSRTVLCAQYGIVFVAPTS